MKTTCQIFFEIPTSLRESLTNQEGLTPNYFILNTHDLLDKFHSLLIDVIQWEELLRGTCYVTRALLIASHVLHQLTIFMKFSWCFYSVLSLFVLNNLDFLDPSVVQVTIFQN